MLNNFLTIKERGTHELEIKRSRFITNMSRIRDETEAKAFITQIKKINYQANHNCSAYVLGDKNDIQRANDDGEPTGTAGVPMLESLKLMNLRNVIAVTTRYFGGIKLGASGLIRAYSNSVSEAAHTIGIVRRTLQKALTFHLAYHQIDIVQNYFSNSPYNIDNADYEADVTVTSFVDTTDIDKIQADLIDLLNGQVKFKVGEARYREILVSQNS